MKFADDSLARDWAEIKKRAEGMPYEILLQFVEDATEILEQDENEELHINPVIRALDHDKRLSIGDIGEILVLIGHFWYKGEDLLENLSYIESVIVAENVAYRLNMMNEDAEEAGKTG